MKNRRKIKVTPFLSFQKMRGAEYDKILNVSYISNIQIFKNLFFFISINIINICVITIAFKSFILLNAKILNLKNTIMMLKNHNISPKLVKGDICKIINIKKLNNYQGEYNTNLIQIIRFVILKIKNYCLKYHIINIDLHGG